MGQYKCQICGKKLYVDRCLGCGRRYCEDCSGVQGYCNNGLCVIYELETMK